MNVKKTYGLIVLALIDILTVFLVGSLFIYENFSLAKKIIIGIITMIILVYLNRTTMRTLFRRVKKNLPPTAKKKAIKKLKRKKILADTAITLLCLLLATVNFYYYQANQTLEQITFNLEPTSITTYAYVLKDSQIDTIDDSDIVNIGFDQQEQASSFSLISNELETAYDMTEYVDYNPIMIETTKAVYQQIIDEEVDMIIIGENCRKALKNTYIDFDQKLKCIKTFTINTGIASLPVDVTTNPFNVLIVGVDVREGEGDIYSLTRTDTMIVASFNPQTTALSLISVPRDSYVPLASDGQYDKLTHAGMLGMGCTIETIEELLDIDINYYTKFNFSALVDLVDALGGIEVDVQYSFTEQDSHDQADAITVEKGKQILNGEKALAYARHRKTQNDHVRNASQQQVLEAILHKLTSFNTLTKINSLFEVLRNNMTTNFSKNELYSLISLFPKLSQLQLDNMVIEGTDLEEYVPKFDQYLWITELHEDSIEQAHKQIETVMGQRAHHTY